MVQDLRPSDAIERGLRQLAGHNAVADIGVPVVQAAVLSGLMSAFGWHCQTPGWQMA